ncbi:hypothetical protein BDV11DRAFT_197322 [Aspergillus similis]
MQQSRTGARLVSMSALAITSNDNFKLEIMYSLFVNTFSRGHMHCLRFTVRLSGAPQNRQILNLRWTLSARAQYTPHP